MQVLAGASAEPNPTYAPAAIAAAVRALARVAPALAPAEPEVLRHVQAMLLRAYQAPSRGLGKLLLYGAAAQTPKPVSGAPEKSAFVAARAERTLCLVVSLGCGVCVRLGCSCF